MKTLDHFSIPIEGMNNGTHRRQFLIDNSFFNQFENSLIRKGQFQIELELEKKSDLIQLDFDILGAFETICDRCTAKVDFPLQTNPILLVKYAQEVYEDLNVMYITRETHHINVSKFLYDSISLAIPIRKVFDCQEEKPFPCDMAVLDKLDDYSELNNEADIKANSIWESLKNINFDNNKK